MALWLRLFRGLGLVGLILGGIIVGAAIGSIATAERVLAQGASAGDGGDRRRRRQGVTDAGAANFGLDGMKRFGVKALG